jgi:hypothetical protein
MDGGVGIDHAFSGLHMLSSFEIFGRADIGIGSYLLLYSTVFCNSNSAEEESGEIGE